jgi:3-oxoacyl-[acyl-carrier protein] reductase
MDLKLKNAKVLVVGASKGIGRAIAIGFAKEGAEVFSVARSLELLETLTSEANALNGKQNKYLVADLMKEDPNKIAEKLLEENGCFDVVVHNVGGSLISRNYLGTIEEHNLSGGFGSSVAEVIADEKIKVNLTRIAIKDVYCAEVGDQKHLRKFNGIDSENIVATILKNLY